VEREETPDPCVFWLSGGVFYDADSDGLWDEGEEGVPNAQVKIASHVLEVVVLVDDSGRFALPVPLDVYTVAVQSVDAETRLTTPAEYEAVPPRGDLLFGLATPVGRRTAGLCLSGPLIGLILLFTFNRIRGAILERNAVVARLADAEDRLTRSFEEDYKDDVRI